MSETEHKAFIADACAAGFSLRQAEFMADSLALRLHDHDCYQYRERTDYD